MKLDDREKMLSEFTKGNLLPLADVIQSGKPVPDYMADAVAGYIRSGLIGFVHALDRGDRSDAEIRDERDRRIWAFIYVRQVRGIGLKKQLLWLAADKFNVSEATAKAAALRFKKEWDAAGSERDLLVWPHWLEAMRQLYEENNASLPDYMSILLSARDTSQD